MESNHNIIPAALAEYCDRVRQRRVGITANMAEFDRVVIESVRPKPPQHENNLCLNGGGLKDVKRTAILLALREEPTKAAAARRLGLSKGGFYDAARRLGITVCLIAMLTGCGVPQLKPLAAPARPRSSLALPALPQANTLRPQMFVIVPPPAPTIRLAWDYPNHGGTVTAREIDDIAFEISATTNLIDWRVVTTVTGTNAVQLPAGDPAQLFTISRTIWTQNPAVYLVRE